jgi:hypothetical protein
MEINDDIFSILRAQPVRSGDIDGSVAMTFSVRQLDGVCDESCLPRKFGISLVCGQPQRAASFPSTPNIPFPYFAFAFANIPLQIEGQLDGAQIEK